MVLHTGKHDLVARLKVRPAPARSHQVDALGCAAHDHGPESDHDHEHAAHESGEAESWAVTAWGERYELFPEIDALIALGAVIRGGTPHFEYVAGECTKGLATVSMKYDIPVAFGVLTVDTIEQAIERAGTKAGNKGAEAALSAIEMISLLRHLDA